MKLDKYVIHEHWDFGGWGPLEGSYSLEDARKEIKRLYSFGSIFVSYGIWDKEEKKYVQ